LGFEVPAPGDYSIGGTGLDLYRNNSGASYPYSISELITLTGSSAGLDFYYYLYDLEVQKAACKSNLVPVTVEVRDPSFTFVETPSGFEFNSLDDQANSYSWDFGDGFTSSDPNPTHNYALAGVYVVGLTLDGICTKTDTVVGGGLGFNNITNQNIQLSPNPTDGLVTLMLSSRSDEDLSISIYNTNGKKILTDVINKGAKAKELDLEYLASAVYFIKVQGKNGSFFEKLVVR
ncbi:MAG: T9SS type A sorting domain-containing protein, partial [Chitinophagales bacterium]|nr:T9SS type A sorting domain-containing protein [Chitinophagales bacterium]